MMSSMPSTSTSTRISESCGRHASKAAATGTATSKIVSTEFHARSEDSPMTRMHRLLTDLAAIEEELAGFGQDLKLYPERGQSAWSPAVDIYETATSFVLSAEVPGLQSSEIDIQVVDRNLVLRGQRRWEREANAEHFHRLESSYGKFERTFSLSQSIDVEEITAKLEDGVLRVVLPKRNSVGKQIEVQ